MEKLARDLRLVTRLTRATIYAGDWLARVNASEDEPRYRLDSWHADRPGENAALYVRKDGRGSRVQMTAQDFGLVVISTVAQE
jgi:hypothetical protein